MQALAQHTHRIHTHLMFSFLLTLIRFACAYCTIISISIGLASHFKNKIVISAAAAAVAVAATASSIRTYRIISILCKYSLRPIQWEQKEVQKHQRRRGDFTKINYLLNVMWSSRTARQIFIWLNARMCEGGKSNRKYDPRTNGDCAGERERARKSKSQYSDE